MYEIHPISKDNLESALEIWNQVVVDGLAFPQMETLTKDSGRTFFDSQSFTGVAIDSTSKVPIGLYILHPNNVGRCGHICNASYAVKKDHRGKGVGEFLVKDCLKKAKELDFKILQFNAVVATNKPALNLYKKLGFTQLGIIPKGFLSIDNTYQDIIPHYIEL